MEDPAFDGRGSRAGEGPRLRGVWARLRASDYWRDVAWLASGTAVAQVVTVLAMPVFSRLFRPSDFAVQNLFVQIAALVGVVATLRYEYLVKVPARDVDAWRLVRVVVGLAAIVVVVLTPLFWVLRVRLAAWAGDAELRPWLFLVPLTAVSTSVAVAVQGYTQRRQDYRRSGMAEVAGKAAFAGSTLLGFWALPGPGGLVIGGLGGAISKLAWLVPGTKRRFEERPVSYGHLMRTHGRMGLSLVVSHLLMAVAGIIPVSFVARAYGADTLGQFTMANTVIALPSLLVGTAVGDVFYQRAARRWAEGLGFADIWRTTASRLLVMGVPMYLVGGLVMQWLFPLIFGHQWVEAGRFGALLCIVGFLSFATSPMGWANVVVNADWYGPLWMGMRVASAGAVIVLARVLHWRAWDFVIATVVQNSLMYLFDYWAKWRFSSRLPSGDPQVTTNVS